MIFFKKKKVEVKQVSAYSSNKEAPNLNELFLESDKVYNLITKENKKDNLNFVEARYLVYGVDLIKSAKEDFSIEFTLKESDIDYLDNIINLFVKENEKNPIDEEIKNGYISGVCGIFGLIANHYKGACWINDNRDNGYKMKCGNDTYYVENKVCKLFDGVNDEDLKSFYASMK